MTPARVLIVENEAVIAADLERELISAGYVVLGLSAHGEEAVQIAEKQRPDLVLMDIRLAGAMDGIAAATAIRGHDVPVVFLTAHTDEATLDRAKLASPFGYVVKPFQSHDIRVAIEIALFMHRKEIEQRRLIAELGEALRMVKRLSGLLPICSGCKRIHDEKKHWCSLEVYLEAHSEAQFTHGLCPECQAAFIASMPPAEE